MRRICSKRCSVYRARLFDNDRFLVGGALVVIFAMTAEETCATVSTHILEISFRQAPLLTKLAF